MSKFWIYPTYLLVENLVNYSNKWRAPTLEVDKSPIVVIDLKIAVGCQEQPRSSGTCTTNKRLRGGNQQIHVFFWEFLGKNKLSIARPSEFQLNEKALPISQYFWNLLLLQFILNKEGNWFVCLRSMITHKIIRFFSFLCHKKTTCCKKFIANFKLFFTLFQDDSESSLKTRLRERVVLLLFFNGESSSQLD